MTLLSACSDISRLITVAATLLSIGVVGVCEGLFRISLAGWCDQSAACRQTPNAVETLLLSQTYCILMQLTNMLPNTLMVTLLSLWKWLLLSSHKVVDLQQGQVKVQLLCKELQQH